MLMVTTMNTFGARQVRPRLPAVSRRRGRGCWGRGPCCTAPTRALEKQPHPSLPKASLVFAPRVPASHASQPEPWSARVSPLIGLEALGKVTPPLGASLSSSPLRCTLAGPGFISVGGTSPGVSPLSAGDRKRAVPRFSCPEKDQLDMKEIHTQARPSGRLYKTSSGIARDVFRNLPGQPGPNSSHPSPSPALPCGWRGVYLFKGLGVFCLTPFQNEIWTQTSFKGSTSPRSGVGPFLEVNMRWFFAAGGFRARVWEAEGSCRGSSWE